MDVLDPIPDKLEIWPVTQNEKEPSPSIHSRLSIDRDMINLAKANSCFFQAILDGFSRQPRPMFDASKTFLFDRGDQFASSNNTGGGVRVVCVDTKNDQTQFLVLCYKVRITMDVN